MRNPVLHLHVHGLHLTDLPEPGIDEDSELAELFVMDEPTDQALWLIEADYVEKRASMPHSVKHAIRAVRQRIERLEAALTKRPPELIKEHLEARLHELYIELASLQVLKQHPVPQPAVAAA